MELEEGKKYIHYCWFGDAKIPRLAKKCIKSWKKYLPDYEIVLWNEDNVDLHECPFIEEAYKKKKWAFVADYVRASVIYKYGGIYLDTDMKIVSDVNFLLDDEDFLGVEDSGAVAVGVWGAKNPHSKLAEELLNYYKSQKHFRYNDLYSLAIPVLITRILAKYGFKKGVRKVQKLKNGTTVYPREYFYPLSYNYHNNNFTKNTCMIHYYDASWTSGEEKRTIWMIRKFGPKTASMMISIWAKLKAALLYYGRVLFRTLQIIFYPFRIILRRVGKKKKGDDAMSEVISSIEKHSDKYLAVSRDMWLGVGASTQNMFGHVVLLPSLGGAKDIELLADAISGNKKIKMVIFSGFDEGWERLVEILKQSNPELRVKVFWHGSNAMHIEEFDWRRFKIMMNMNKTGLIDEVAFAKKSMSQQYRKNGYNVSFLPNNVILDRDNTNYDKTKKQNNKKRIGIYSSGDRWVKNMYNQLAAASVIDNVEVDVIPFTDRMMDFLDLLGLEVDGEKRPIPRDMLLERIARDDVVLYTTFVECAPILPLECLELGTICITGDNHHYWEGTELEKYLVEPKVDNPMAIAARVELCLENKDKILKLYADWKKDYNRFCKKELRRFLKED